MRAAAALCAVALVASVIAGERSAHAAPGKHCPSGDQTQLVLDQALLAALNPSGLEHRLRLSVCTPLITRPGVLFDYTNLEAGLLNFVAPTQLHLGVYVKAVPLSFLVLRAEVSGFHTWTIPIPGAGYIPLAGYTPFDAAVIDPPPEGPGAPTSAHGLRGLLGATLQAELPLAGPYSLILYDAFNSEYMRVGNAPFYYDVRHDVVLAGPGDWVLQNTALALVSLAFDDRHALRFGPSDDLIHVPASGYVANLIAGTAVFVVRGISPRLPLLEVFVRGGLYSAHAFRAGEPSFAAGLHLQYDATP